MSQLGYRVSVLINTIVFIILLAYLFRAEWGWNKTESTLGKWKRKILSADRFLQDPIECHKAPPFTGKKGGLYLLGDSHILFGEWNKVFEEKSLSVHGLPGECSQCLLYRLPQLLKNQPEKIVLMIGANDRVKGRSEENLKASWYQVLASLKQSLPQTPVFLTSLLPHRLSSKEVQGYTLESIRRSNRILEDLSREFKTHYLDIHSKLVDAEGALRSDYSQDGIHLTPAGYAVWYKELLLAISRTGLKNGFVAKSIPLLTPQGRREQKPGGGPSAGR